MNARGEEKDVEDEEGEVKVYLLVPLYKHFNGRLHNAQLDVLTLLLILPNPQVPATRTRDNKSSEHNEHDRQGISRYVCSRAGKGWHQNMTSGSRATCPEDLHEARRATSCCWFKQGTSSYMTFLNVMLISLSLKLSCLQEKSRLSGMIQIVKCLSVK